MYLLVPSTATAAQGQHGHFTMESTTTKALLGHSTAGQFSRISFELHRKLLQTSEFKLTTDQRFDTLKLQSQQLLPPPASQPFSLWQKQLPIPPKTQNITPSNNPRSPKGRAGEHGAAADRAKPPVPAPAPRAGGSAERGPAPAPRHPFSGAAPSPSGLRGPCPG